MTKQVRVVQGLSREAAIEVVDERIAAAEINGVKGDDGLSAYEVWLSLGNSGTEQDFITSLRGQDGASGTNGTDGIDGDDGLSAYEVWVSLGNSGTEQDFIDSLRGQDGATGAAGADGVDGVDGVDGQTNNNGGGWAFYSDDQYTQASPLVINQGSTVQVTINNASIINDQLPIGYNDFWDSAINRIKSKNAGDTIKYSLRMKGTSSVNQGGISYGLYIGAGQTIKILGESKPFLRDANEENDIVIEESPFHGETFRTNGGAFFITAVRGNITLWDFGIKVELSYRADNQAIYNLVTGATPPDDDDGKPDGTIYLQV